MDGYRDIFQLLDDAYLCVVNKEQKQLLFQNGECPFGDPLSLIGQMEKEKKRIEYEGVLLELRLTELIWEEHPAWLFQIANTKEVLFRSENSKRLFDIEKVKSERQRYFNQISLEIKNDVEQIAEKIENAEKMKDADELSDSLNQITQATTDLLDRVNEELDEPIDVNGRCVLQPEQISIQCISLLLQTKYQARVRRKGITLKLLMQIPAGEMIFVDIEKLMRILYNFMEYQIDNTKISGCIEVTIQKVQGVETGLEFRIQNSKQCVPHKETTSLGLTIANSYADLMGAKISIQEEEGNYQLCRLLLPYEQIT